LLETTEENKFPTVTAVSNLKGSGGTGEGIQQVPSGQRSRLFHSVIMVI
jgi:hypothetical protein